MRAGERKREGGRVRAGERKREGERVCPLSSRDGSNFRREKRAGIRALPPSFSLLPSLALPPSPGLPLSLPLPTSLTLSLSLPLSRPPSLSPSLSRSPSLPLSLPPCLSPALPPSPSLSLSVDLFFYDVAARWISLGLLGCQLDREESTIAAVLDLENTRVGARFG